jgi:hypothetical protein
MIHCSKLKKIYFITEFVVFFLIQFRPSLFETKNQQFPATLIFNAAFTPNAGLPTYKRELRHITQDLII